MGLKTEWSWLSVLIVKSHKWKATKSLTSLTYRRVVRFSGRFPCCALKMFHQTGSVLNILLEIRPIDLSYVYLVVRFLEACLPWVREDDHIFISGELLIKWCWGLRTHHSHASVWHFLSGLSPCILHLIDISSVCMCKHADLKMFHSFV